MKYKLTLETLSPLHIGTGTILLKDFDYVSTREMTYVINQDVIYSAEFDSRGGEARLNVPPGRLVSADQWSEDSPTVRYTLRGGTTIEQIHEQIKDIHGQCYLPGSSLKGALRTALLAYASLNGTLDQAYVNYRQNVRGSFVKEAAAQNFETTFFRPLVDDANHDILRALQVFDSNPLPVSPSQLLLCSARVFTGGEPGLPVVVEALQKDATLEMEVTIDELALKYADRLGWEDRRLWLAHLVPILQSVSRRRIQDELQTARAKGFTAAEKFYQQLDQLAAMLDGTNSAVMQLGWGTGWNGMTIAPMLPKLMRDEARTKFELGRPPTQHGKWVPDLSKPYPKSRRLSAVNEIPGVPFGWVAITFEPVGQPTPFWETLVKQAGSIAKPVVRETLKQPPVSDTSSNISTQKPAPDVQKPPQRLLILSFTATPKIGDCFEAEVFDDNSGEILLLIPGVEDVDAYAVLRPGNYPAMMKSFKVIKCVVIGLEADKTQKNCVRVLCRAL